MTAKNLKRRFQSRCHLLDFFHTVFYQRTFYLPLKLRFRIVLHWRRSKLVVNISISTIKAKSSLESNASQMMKFSDRHITASATNLCICASQYANDAAVASAPTNETSQSISMLNIWCIKHPKTS